MCLTAIVQKNIFISTESEKHEKGMTKKKGGNWMILIILLRSCLEGVVTGFWGGNFGRVCKEIKSKINSIFYEIC